MWPVFPALLATVCAAVRTVAEPRVELWAMDLPDALYLKLRQLEDSYSRSMEGVEHKAYVQRWIWSVQDLLAVHAKA